MQRDLPTVRRNPDGPVLVGITIRVVASLSGRYKVCTQRLDRKVGQRPPINTLVDFGSASGCLRGLSQLARQPLASLPPVELTIGHVVNDDVFCIPTSNQS